MANKGKDNAQAEQSETVVRAKQATRASQPKTRIKAKQPTRVVKRVTVIQQEQPHGTKWLGVSPWIVIAGIIAAALLVFLPIYPAEKTVDKTETIMVPVTKEKPEEVKADETIKTYQGYMVEQGGIEPVTTTVTTGGSGWSGTWQSINGKYVMTTTQNGNQVTADFTRISDGATTQFVGTVSGYKCTGRRTGPADAGITGLDWELTLAPDGQSIVRLNLPTDDSPSTYIRTGTGTTTITTGTRTGTGNITIDAVAEIVDVQRARGPNGTWILTLTAYDGTQTIYRNIVMDDLTKTGRVTVQVTKTVMKPYTAQEPKEVVKQEIVKFRVNLLGLINRDY